MASRPAIPAQMKRDVLIESGYRCAMPHCRETQIEIHHIVDFAAVREHSFDNLIALCANCHQRVTKGEIDRKAIRQVKANLGILGHRYSELERRYLQMASERGYQANAVTIMSGGLDLLMTNLVGDGFLLQLPVDSISINDITGPGGLSAPDFPLAVAYVLTAQGREFIEHWETAQPLD